MEPLLSRRQLLGRVGVGVGASLVGALPWPLRATEKVQTEAEALRIGWPQLAGPFSTFETVPIAAPLVHDLSQAKVLWVSECQDFGRAKGGSAAYRTLQQFTAEAIAKMGSHPGSWSGPIVANGLIFCASWRPHGDWYDVQGSKVRLDAEDIVAAIDALTGKTRWLTAEPGGILRGGGKRQGCQVAPVHHRGVVYSLGSTGRLFAHDTGTGKKLWESDVHPARAALAQSREAALKTLAGGQWPKYDLNPNWCSSLTIAQDVLIVPDQKGGLLGVDRVKGTRIWSMPAAIAPWATPSVWRHNDREYVLCANIKGELRLIDPAAGKELWKVSGLGPTWFTLTPGNTHVLVNIVPDSGKGDERKPGRLGFVRLSPSAGELDWKVGDGKQHTIPVWMDSGARGRVLYRDGKFLATCGWQGHSERGGANGGSVLLLEEASGKVLAELPAVDAWNDQLSGAVYWCGDRILNRPDTYHGPNHGGRHPWIHWSLEGRKITRLPGKMDLSEFTNAYEVTMEAPLVGGLVFERTEKGGIVCYDLRAK
jgi:outer membrane protein assembly factor BamB